MSDTLYLDTARLGLMSPSAQQLQNSFARLAGDPHGLLYFSDFLALGMEGCPADWRQRFQGLAAWRGLEGLTRSVRRLTRAPQDSDVLFASRSATLMEIATQRLASVCQRVLTVDLLWPPYRRTLAKRCRQTGVEMVVCPLRSVSLFDEEPKLQLADRICEAVEHNRCDGLVLPLIDHRGVTLPLDVIMRRLRSRGTSPKYVVVDASQALGQVPIELNSFGCHFLVAGAHKWVGGYHPLGVGVSVESMRHEIARMVKNDPLLRLTQEAIGMVTARHGETAAILPLLSAAAAIADLTHESVEQRLSVRQVNRRHLSTLLEYSGWHPVRRTTERHGMLLARPPASRRYGNPQSVCRSFGRHGISVTCYANRMVRFSLPSVPFSESQESLLFAALSVEAASLRGQTSPPPLAPNGTLSCPTVESTTAQVACSTKRTPVVSLAPIPTENSTA